MARQRLGDRPMTTTERGIRFRKLQEEQRAATLAALRAEITALRAALGLNPDPAADPAQGRG